MNIKQELLKSKPHFTEKAQIIKDYLFMHNSLKPYIGKQVQDRTGFVHSDFATDFTITEDPCPLSVPLEYREPGGAPRKKRGKRTPPEKKYPNLYACAQAGFIPDDLLVSTYQMRLLERPLVFWKSDSGEASVFWGKVKGDDTYNAYITDRINNCSAALVRNYNFFYFLTLTYAYKVYGTDIVKAWQTFQEQIKKTFRYLRKHYHMGYVCVLEATKKGYPHAHVILGVNGAVEKFHEKISDGRAITSGRMFHALKKHTASPVFKLQKAGGKGLVKYLGKYVAKSAERFCQTTDPANVKLSTASRKALLSCLMPVLAQVRQYRSSIRDNIQPGINWAEYSKEDYDYLADLVKIGCVTPEGDAILIRLLNKLTSACRCRAIAIFKKTHKAVLAEHVGWYSEAPPDLEVIFKASGYPLGCPGCVITVFLENLKSPEGAQAPLPGYYFAKNKQGLCNISTAGNGNGQRKATGSKRHSGVILPLDPHKGGPRAEKEEEGGVRAEENGQPIPTGGAERNSNGAYHSPHEGLAALERWFLSK